MRTYQKIASLVFFLSIAILSQAQVSIGFKVGRTSSNVAIQGTGDILNPKSIGNYSIGAVAEIPLANSFAFQPELSLNRKGFKIKEGIDVNLFDIPLPLGVEAHTEVKYIEIPLLGKYKFGQERIGGYVLAGPYVGYARQAKLKTKANVIIDFNISSTDIDLSNDNYKRLEAGAMAGVGFWTATNNGQFFADVRYQHSLTNSFDDPIVDVRMYNKCFEFNAGYLFAF